MARRGATAHVARRSKAREPQGTFARLPNGGGRRQPRHCGEDGTVTGTTSATPLRGRICTTDQSEHLVVVTVQPSERYALAAALRAGLGPLRLGADGVLVPADRAHT